MILMENRQKSAQNMEKANKNDQYETQSLECVLNLQIMK